jgi:alpha-D-ribose 1-methylphosphonate 5-triphosphate synthase subunit PhnH
MSQSEADALASAVRSNVPGAQVAVRPDAADWLVHVETVSAGAFTLYDEDDWRWLQPQIVQGMQR